MKKDFDQLCELHDSVHEIAMKISADLVGRAKDETEKLKYEDDHKKCVASYVQMQRGFRKEHYNRGITVGVISACLAVLTGNIIDFVITNNKK